MENCADALTHPIDGAEVTRHLELTMQVQEAGRHRLAPKVEIGGETNVWNEEGESEEETIDSLIFRQARNKSRQTQIFDGY